VELKAYVHDYLREEIQAEALSRNIPAFSRFLLSAAVCQRDAVQLFQRRSRLPAWRSGRSAKYYQILEDTFSAGSSHREDRRRIAGLIETAKFLLLRCRRGFGRCWATPRWYQGQGVRPGIRAFHHPVSVGHTATTAGLISHELLAYGQRLGSRPDPGEADVAIEIKSGEDVEGRTKGLHLFLEEQKCQKAFIVSRENLCRES